MLPVCTGPLAEGFVEGDHVPLGFDPKTGTVTMSPLMKKSYAAYFEGGLNALELPVHLEGLGAPPSFAWGAFELVVGSNPAAAFYFLGNVLVRIIDALATDAQKKRFIAPMLAKHWGGTMVLTEPDAGSNVGAEKRKSGPR